MSDRDRLNRSSRRRWIVAASVAAPLLSVVVILATASSTVDVPPPIVRDVSLTEVADAATDELNTAYELSNGETVYGPPAPDFVARDAVLALQRKSPPPAGAAGRRRLASWLPPTLGSLVMPPQTVDAIVVEFRDADVKGVRKTSTDAKRKKLLITVGDTPLVAPRVHGAIGRQAMIQLGSAEETRDLFETLRDDELPADE